MHTMEKKKRSGWMIRIEFRPPEWQRRAIVDAHRMYGASQLQIAEWVGVSQSTVSRVLRAKPERMRQ